MIRTTAEADPDKVEARTELSSSQRADYLAVLWFVAEAEHVPTRLMKVYISEERLTESELYKSIFGKGEARGEARGAAQSEAKTILRILSRRLGALDPALSERIQGLSDRETLTAWYEAALDIVDAEGAERLVETIRKASLP